MTENETTETTEISGEQATTENPPTEAPGPEGGDDLAKVRREAAAYRRKLREAEGQNEALTGQLAAMQRSEVERLAGETLADAGDLWRSGGDLAEMLTEEGTVDPEKVAKAVGEVAEAHPHWRAPAPDFDGGARTSVEAPPDFASTLRKAAGG